MLSKSVDFKNNTVVSIKSKPVVIGCKFDGPNGFVDTQNGIYWETMPESGANADLLQKALLYKKDVK